MAVPAATYAVIGVVIPAYMTNFVVKPNELVREFLTSSTTSSSPERHSTWTKWKKFPSTRLTNAVFDPVKHEPTLANVRLWDWRALQDTLRQVQEIRTYYDSRYRHLSLHFDGKLAK